MNTKKTILNCHLFKNAGTTLDWALERNFGNGFCDHRENVEMRQRGICYLDEYLHDNPSIISVSSHHMPFMPEHEGAYWWLVLLRAPLRRIRSVYEFEARQPISSLGSKMAKKLNFSEYIHWRMRDDVPAVIKNYHVRYLNNITNSARVIDESFVDRAFSRLSLNNVIFGTVEHFDESMVIFEEVLKEDFKDIDLAYIKQNVSRKKTDSPLDYLDKLTLDSQEIILKNNQLDIKLYDVVESELEKLTGNIPDFENKLTNFRSRCKTLLNT